MAIKKESDKKPHPQMQAHPAHHKTPDELAPLEEQIAQSGQRASNNGGAIIVDTAALNIPTAFTEKGEKEKQIIGFDRIAFVIVTFALLFICFIAYLISIEPPKTDAEPSPTVEAQPK